MQKFPYFKRSDLKQSGDGRSSDRTSWLRVQRASRLHSYLQIICEAAQWTYQLHARLNWKISSSYHFLQTLNSHRSCTSCYTVLREGAEISWHPVSGSGTATVHLPIHGRFLLPSPAPLRQLVQNHLSVLSLAKQTYSFCLRHAPVAPMYSSMVTEKLLRMAPRPPAVIHVESTPVPPCFLTCNCAESLRLATNAWWPWLLTCHAVFFFSSRSNSAALFHQILTPFQPFVSYLSKGKNLRGRLRQLGCLRRFSPTPMWRHVKLPPTQIDICCVSLYTARSSTKSFTESISTNWCVSLAPKTIAPKSCWVDTCPTQPQKSKF